MYRGSHPSRKPAMDPADCLREAKLLCFESTATNAQFWPRLTDQNCREVQQETLRTNTKASCSCYTKARHPGGEQLSQKDPPLNDDKWEWCRMFVNCPVGLIYLHIPSKDPISGGERQEETYCVCFFMCGISFVFRC